MVAKTEIIFTLVLVSDFFKQSVFGIQASERPLSWACEALGP